jgi:hypothetical protein
LDTGTTGKQTGDRPQGKQQTGQMMVNTGGRHIIALSLKSFFHVTGCKELKVSGVRCQGVVMLNTDTLSETPPIGNSKKIERSMFDVHQFLFSIKLADT